MKANFPATGLKLLLFAGLLGALLLSCSRSARLEQALRERADKSGAPAAALHFPTPREIPGAGPFQQNDWFRLSWQTGRLFAWEQRDAERGAVVFAGDSIMQGWQDLNQAFPEFKTANRGIAGDTTGGLLFRFREDVLQLNPRAVVLLCGINDLFDGAPVDLVVRNIQALARLCREAEPPVTVFVCTVLPVSPKRIQTNRQVCALNSELAKIAAETRGVMLVDCWRALANSNGVADQRDFPDYLHPSAKGYAKLKATIRQALDQLVVAPSD